MTERNIAEPEKLVDTLVSLAKRRGFIFQSSEIYGGVAAIYDFGPLGVALRRNIRDLWWRHTVDLRHDVVGLESSVIMHPRVWEASGHVESFTDPLVECKNCHSRYRADKLDGPCPNCGSTEFSDSRQFNLMFKTYLGPVEDSAAQTYLRPETAQGMFVQFPNIVTSTRRRIPFGIAQVGKSFRNEITTEHFIFRLREFEQMELEFFVKPGTDLDWLEQWKAARMAWWTEVLGVRTNKIRARLLDDDELSHYSARGYEVEYEFPWGWGELEGIQDRTDYDLRRHSEFSGKDLSYFEDETKERYIPYVIEPSMGLERAMFTLMLEAYDEEEVRGEKRVVLHFHPNVAPIQVAVLPLSKNEQLLPMSREVEELLTPHFRIEYDETQSIGRRYRRHDEIGTPFAVTIDFDSLEDRAVTIRDRDSMEQERVPVAELVERLSAKYKEAGGR
ncbi:MAG: glycine--tRNA ligase [Candidatus Dormibacteraeota bacterium]|nr:glycine--tRNA ligase [Candidatus Dormibacteraeota bacterium]